MTGARARRGVVLTLALALAVLSLVPVLRIRFETDVLQLMPLHAGSGGPHGAEDALASRCVHQCGEG